MMSRAYYSARTGLDRDLYGEFRVQCARLRVDLTTQSMMEGSPPVNEHLNMGYISKPAYLLHQSALPMVSRYRRMHVQEEGRLGKLKEGVTLAYQSNHVDTGIVEPSTGRFLLTWFWTDV